MDIQTIEQPKQTSERVDLKLKPEYVAPNVTAEKVDLSQNIQKFDKKVIVHTKDPYAYNTISLKREIPTPSPSESIKDPVYHELAKILGVDTVHDWGTAYSQVVEIAEWAKGRVKNPEDVAPYIYQALKEIPSITGKRLADVRVWMKMSKPIAKPPIKKAIKRQPVRTKMSTEQFVEKWMEKALQ